MMWPLVWRLVRREGLRGELRWFVLALALSVGCVLSVALVADRLEQVLGNTGRDFLAADRVLQSATPVPEAWLEEARRRGLKLVTTTSFASMLFLGDQMQLASIKAVEAGYPFYGTLELSPSASVAPGRIWLSPRLMALLNARIGQPLDVGATRLTVAGELRQEPDEGFSPFLLAPHALMHQADLAQARVILPGSRIQYRYLLQGERAALDGWQAWLRPQLEPGQRLIAPGQANDLVSRQLARSERFFRLASLIGLLLGCLAMSIAMDHFASRQRDMMALLKTLGAGRRQLWQLMGGLLLGLMALSFLLGGVLGFALHLGFVALLGSLLPPDLPPPSLWPFALGLAVCLFITLLLSLVPFLRLLRVPPLRVLRQQLDTGLPRWLGLPVVVAGTLLLSWLFTGDVRLASGLLLGMAGLMLLLGALAYGLLHLLPRPAVGSGLYLAITHLRRNRVASLGQLSGIALALMLLGVLGASRQEILSGFQAYLPADAPNRFLVNIADADKPQLEQFLLDQGLAHSGLYPVLRGRLTAINDEQLNQDGDGSGREGIRRELTLTWQAGLPRNNQLLAGRWWTPAGRDEVSVESGVAERLGIRIGDRLTFVIDGQTRQVSVTSLRKVDWEDMQPNFYMIFSPDVLAGYPVSWLASLRVPPGQTALEVALVRQFPTVSLINTDEILARLQGVLDKVSLALGLMLILVTGAAVLVLLVQVQAGMAARWQELVLMRTLGAGSRLLRRALQWELAATGLLAGLAAALICELVLGVLQSLWTETPWQWHGLLWLVLPLLGMGLVSLSAQGMVRRLLHGVLVQRLREL